MKLRTLVLFFSIWGLGFSCATTKDLSRQIQVVDNRVKNLECVVASVDFLRQFDSCALAGAICEERVKRLGMTASVFTNEDQMQRDPARRSPRTLTECRERMQLCAQAAYASFLAIKKHKGCK